MKTGRSLQDLAAELDRQANARKDYIAPQGQIEAIVVETAERPRERRKRMNGSKMKIVYVIVERNGKSYWNRIGVAFVNNDGSINVKLDAFPVSGEMQIRDYVARDEDSGEPR